jgi:hypothetical protein
VARRVAPASRRSRVVGVETAAATRARCSGDADAAKVAAMATPHSSVVVVVRAWRDDDGVRGIIQTDAMPTEIAVGSIDGLCRTITALLELLRDPDDAHQ